MGKTKVSFRVDHSGVFAVFPDEKYDCGYGNSVSCYSHIGQHSGCSPNYYKNRRKAKPEEYADLKAELEQIGYELEVL